MNTLITLDVLKRHRFPAHGELTLSWEDRFLHTQARGPYNLEMIDAGMRLIAQSGAPYWPQDGKFVELVHWHDSMMMPPDALARLEASMDRWAQKGRMPACTVVVAPPDVEGRWLMLPKLLAMWRRTRPTEVFETLAPALERVQAQLLAWRSSGH